MAFGQQQKNLKRGQGSSYTYDLIDVRIAALVTPGLQNSIKTSPNNVCISACNVVFHTKL